MTDKPQFLFTTGQNGGEAVLKRELARKWPEFRFAFSRPGFLTFKLPPDTELYDDFDLDSIFARSHGFSLGKVAGDDASLMAENVWKTFGDRPCRRVHVWAREVAAPSEIQGGSPLDRIASRARCAIQTTCPWPERLAEGAYDPTHPADPGDFVLDCVVVEPDQWWVGYHRAHGVSSQWPGGMFPLEMPCDAVSRAWLKMEEALRWARLPIPAEARFAELGSAPGGSSQALLGRGWYVIGVDPAEMAPAVAEHPRFTHIRRRASQVRRREFRRIRWLTADMNVAPSYTLSVVEDIVTHPEVNVRGMLLTLKLPQWDLADHIPEYLDRVRSWGYNRIQARQLQHNRQEICVAALQQPFYRKGLRRR
ncbi:MAG: hypothetical protein HUU20_05325 [Pirellulales bacterium]|nr:hypothetical protein [Pirellulales bacterium]